MDFPIAELMDEAAGYERLVTAIHPDRLTCPRCGSTRHGVHRPHRQLVLDHRCRDRRAVFNAFTGTVLQGTSRRPSAPVLILRGVAQGVSTARLARELGCDGMKRQGQGTFENDRPPVAATVGRVSDRACFHVIGNSDRRTLEGLVQATTSPGATLNTDEQWAYERMPELGRGHVTVNHGAGEQARDD